PCNAGFSVPDRDCGSGLLAAAVDARLPLGGMRLCAGPGAADGTSSGGRGANELSEPLKNCAPAAADSTASHMPVATTSWPPLQVLVPPMPMDRGFRPQ